jgi:hypothetical protein
MRQRHRHALGRRKPVLAVQNHRVRAVQHHHRRARALVVALVHLQIVVLQIQRQLQPLARNRRAKRCRRVQIQRVAEFVSPRSAARLNPRRPVPRVVPSKARFAQRPHQIAQRFEAQKVQALVGHLEADVVTIAAIPHLPVRLVNPRRPILRHRGDVILPLHPLHQLVNQFVQRALGHHPVQQLARLAVKKVTRLEHAPQRLAQIVHRMVQILKAVERVVVAGVEQIVRQRIEQALEIDLRGQIAGVLRISNALHRSLNPVFLTPDP